MNKKRNITAFLLSVSAMVFVLLPVSGFATLTDLEKCQNERTALQIELQRYKAIEAEMKAKIAEVEAESVKLKADFAAKSAEADKAVADKQTELDNAKKENEALKKEKETSQQAVKAANDKAAQSAKAATDQKNADAQRIKELQTKIAELEKKLTQEQQACAARIKELENQIIAQGGKPVESTTVVTDDSTKNGLQTKTDKEGGTSTVQPELKDKSDNEMIAVLEATIADLNGQLEECQERVRRQKERIERLAAQREELKKELNGDLKEGELYMPPAKGRIVINIHDGISFDAGSAQLKRSVTPALNKIAKVLKNYPEHKIIVEGHTDSDPIEKSRFESNQALSEARANAVYEYMLQNTNLDKSVFTVVGRGETRPIVQNDSPANKALNRRVDIIVIPASDDAEMMNQFERRNSGAAERRAPREPQSPESVEGSESVIIEQRNAESFNRMERMPRDQRNPEMERRTPVPPRDEQATPEQRERRAPVAPRVRVN